MDLLGDEVDRKRRDDSQRRLHRGIGEEMAHEGDREPGSKSHDQAADGSDQEGQDAVPHGGGRAHRRGQRQAVGRQGGGVVEQALAAQQRHHAPGQTQTTTDGLRRHSIGRGDHRTQDKGGGPGEVGDGVVRDHSDPRGGRERQPDGQQSDRAYVFAQRHIGTVQGRRVEQRRQHREQDQLGFQGELGKTWDPAEPQPHHDQHQRGREPESATDGGQDHRDHGDDQQSFVHRPNSSLSAHPTEPAKDTGEWKWSRRRRLPPPRPAT